MLMYICAWFLYAYEHCVEGIFTSVQITEKGLEIILKILSFCRVRLFYWLLYGEKGQLVIRVVKSTYSIQQMTLFMSWQPDSAVTLNRISAVGTKTRLIPMTGYVYRDQQHLLAQVQMLTTMATKVNLQSSSFFAQISIFEKG